MNKLLLGALAGAAGTIALDVTTYADMAARGRPSSNTPAEVVRKTAERAGIDTLARPDDQAGDKTKNRRTALGALLGYGVGISIGTLFGAVRSAAKRRFPPAASGLLLGALAMAASDIPAARMGATDPKKWGAAGWAADIVPHIAYGAVTAVVFDSLSE